MLHKKTYSRLVCRFTSAVAGWTRSKSVGVGNWFISSQELKTKELHWSKNMKCSGATGKVVRDLPEEVRLAILRGNQHVFERLCNTE